MESSNENLEELKGIVDQLAMAKDKKSELAEMQSQIQSEIDTIEAELIKRMDAMQLKSFRLSDGRLISNVVSSYISVTDKDALYPWLKSMGFEDMFTVNAKTLSGFVNDRIRSREEVPPGIEQYTKSRISIRRS